MRRGVAQLESEAGGSRGPDSRSRLIEVSTQSGPHIVGSPDQDPLHGIGKCVNAWERRSVLLNGDWLKRITTVLALKGPFSVLLQPSARVAWLRAR